MRSVFNLNTKENPKSTFGKCFGLLINLNTTKPLKGFRFQKTHTESCSGLRRADHSPSTSVSGQLCYALRPRERRVREENNNK